jgi:hypothetical protein
MSDNRLSHRDPICSICHMPVFLDEAKTDEVGHAIHENCYLAKVGMTNAPSSRPDLYLLKTPQTKQNPNN